MKYFRLFLIIFIIAFLGLMSNNKVLAQAPIISYENSYSFKFNDTAPLILPTNTGGSIPNVEYGTTSTLAGSVMGFADGNGVNAQFKYPQGISIDKFGNIYVADRYNNRVRKVTPSGEVTTIAGNVSSGFINGTGTGATFNQPADVAVDASGNLYVTEIGNHSVRKITAAGLVTTLAGTGTAGYLNGTASTAKFNIPFSIQVDRSNNIYVADRYNHRIRMISAVGEVTTYVGSGITTGINAQGESASFNNPVGVSIDENSVMYVGDYGNNLVRRVGTQKYVTTLAGCFCGGTDDEDGILAGFKNPFGLAVDKNGDVFVADYNSNRIRRITPDGNVSTLAGSGDKGKVNGLKSTSSFNNPTDVAVDNNGNVYVSDYGNHLIRKIVCTGYTITPNLPQGLVFNSATGQITGFPTSNFETTTYTVTAYNKDGISKATFSMSSIGLTSILQIENAHKFTLYPNPTTGKKIFAEISETNGDFKEVIIRDLSGKTIFNQTYPVLENLIEIDFEYSQYDMLFVEIVGLGIEKLLIQK